MYQPAGTAVDSGGDLFIADSGDNVIREVTPTAVSSSREPASRATGSR
ncbi:hypothetical protein [Streptomyces sp. NPDC008139]